MLKTKDLRDLSIEELKEKEEEFNKELFNLKIQKATGQLGNTAIIGKTKKDLARIKTVLRESALSSATDRQELT
jgi:large subunit ribosomal protein L29